MFIKLVTQSILLSLSISAFLFTSFYQPLSEIVGQHGRVATVLVRKLFVFQKIEFSPGVTIHFPFYYCSVCKTKTRLNGIYLKRLP